MFRAAMRWTPSASAMLTTAGNLPEPPLSPSRS
jgi:hypothetical protein